MQKIVQNGYLKNSVNYGYGYYGYGYFFKTWYGYGYGYGYFFKPGMGMGMGMGIFLKPGMGMGMGMGIFLESCNSNYEQLVAGNDPNPTRPLYVAVNERIERKVQEYENGNVNNKLEYLRGISYNYNLQ
ncbi:MAG: hypothetical protein GY820_10300 [Gammaproteobacteria bacterium]|nr:hypothetical protein [Gammaproteobacteria bacterium]